MIPALSCNHDTKQPQTSSSDNTGAAPMGGDNPGLVERGRAGPSPGLMRRGASPLPRRGADRFSALETASPRCGSGSNRGRTPRPGPPRHARAGRSTPGGPGRTDFTRVSLWWSCVRHGRQTAGPMTVAAAWQNLKAGDLVGAAGTGHTRRDRPTDVNAERVSHAAGISRAVDGRRENTTVARTHPRRCAGPAIRTAARLPSQR
jgi:hypothetical protein